MNLWEVSILHLVLRTVTMSSGMCRILHAYIQRESAVSEVLVPIGSLVFCPVQALLRF